MSLDDYRAGYRAGYFAGRIAQMTGEPYDARTELERKGPTEHEPDPWDDEKEAVD
jgi:hypothetical protein